MSLISSEWDNFRRDVIPEDALDIQVDSMKIAFYAGLKLMHTMHKGLGDKDITEDQALIHLISWETEIDNYFKQLTKDEVH